MWDNCVDILATPTTSWNRLDRVMELSLSRHGTNLTTSWNRPDSVMEPI